MIKEKLKKDIFIMIDDNKTIKKFHKANLKRCFCIIKSESL